MSKWTPGPWHMWKTVAGEFAVDAASVTVGRINDLSDETMANARLIAAAPEMYEALKAFVAAHEKSLQLEKTDVALRLSKAAIAKAEGK